MEFYVSPVLISFGFLQVRYYGLVYALGFLALYLVLIKKKILTENQASSLLVYCGLGMLIFARLFHILFDNFSYYVSRPLEIFFIWQGGLAFFGGFIGFVFGGYLFFRNKKNAFLQFTIVSDIAVLVASATLIFGRVANLINQELVGRVTTEQMTPWCFYFVDYMTNSGPVFESVCRHPYQIYAAISHAIMFLILVFVYMYLKNRVKVKQLKENSYAGLLFVLFVCLYGLFRFIVDFWRDDAIVILGLTHWQILSLVIFIIGVFGIYFYLKSLPFLGENTSSKHKSFSQMATHQYSHTQKRR
jgi:phosphatidylglycerol---prolipoprotein diacylglyceryl transferase